MRISDDKIPLSQCEEGAVYELHSRNLVVGVFVKDKAGFIGIREKFGSRYLFMEYHYDIGAPYGTVQPVKKLSLAPDDIPIKVHLETVDDVTRRPVAFDRPVADGGKGWYFVDTGEASELIRAGTLPNEKLFEFLEGVEKSVVVKCKKCEYRYTPSRFDKDGHCPGCASRIKHDRPQL